MVSSAIVGRHFGPYEIRDVLGKGASATVYVGRRTDGVDVAVKVLSAIAMGNADFRRAIAREFAALQKLDHPGVIEAHTTGTIADILFIEMEWIDGLTLSDTLEMGKPIDGSRAAHLGMQIAAALQHCHDRGVVHRDLKPSNILLRDEMTPVLFDFGLAQDAEDPDAEPGRLYATPMTASPEQVRAEGPVDGRADVYALGVTLFRLFTGKLPFYGERMDLIQMHVESEPPRPTSINKKLSAEVEQTILRSLAKNPEDRYASAAELGEALSSLSAEDLAKPGGGSRWRRR